AAPPPAPRAARRRRRRRPPPPAPAPAPGPAGPGGLASAAARARILDEIHIVVAPAVVGGGTRFLDEGLRLDLELTDERRFTGGAVYLAYRVRR
ncbi:dihydrofolate reductase family protein, partial [Microbacterium ureisolvens]|uniref:dihydrofolate reductase family protein n=1 Tax=Microbacterium ureisolvens TaxID=2781186 RepID=UPI00362DC7CA